MAEDANLHNTSNSYWYDLFSWAYAGVDFTLPGNGGSECVNFLSPQQRLVESGLASLLAFFICYKAYPRLTLPATKLKSLTEGEAAGKRLLLVLMCLTWGCELGFKLATRQMIWIFNPCHVATAVQIYLLAAAPSKAVTAAFRLHMHMLTGAPIAILFPVINTRLLPFETEVYYVQHILMLVIPFYLMSLGDPYIPERLGDFSWAAMTFGVAFLYHFIPLQILAMRISSHSKLWPQE
ncbi:transmembrane protein 164-like isoform X2 [Littorina saxatilis]|uniref:transmembrane protein 164-like isoform X2 n=1 Tax=Littorina saxatilis TaxID=31220 RepID=UPI0038B445B5